MNWKTVVVGGIVFLSLAWGLNSVWADIKDITGTAKLVFKKK